MGSPGKAAFEAYRNAGGASPTSGPAPGGWNEQPPEERARWEAAAAAAANGHELNQRPPGC